MQICEYKSICYHIAGPFGLIKNDANLIMLILAHTMQRFPWKYLLIININCSVIILQYSSICSIVWSSCLDFESNLPVLATISRLTSNTNFLTFLIHMQLDFNISSNDISNTMDMSEWFVSPNQLFFKHFIQDILNSPIYSKTRL